MQPLSLLGAEHSYFTAKARAYLKWSGLPFHDEIATIDVYKETILPKVGWPVVPVLKDPNISGGAVFIQDTSDIIDYCEHTYSTKITSPALPPPNSFKQRMSCFCLEIMGDEWFKLAAMHYRWSFPENTNFLEHEWMRMQLPNTRAEELKEVNARMRQSMKTMSGALPALGVSKDTIPGIEQTFLEFLDLFEEHLKYHPYLLGGRPCLADFALIGPLYAHLYRDPVPGAIMKSKAPRVAEWVDRCNKRTSNLRSDNDGSLLPGDAVPETLWAILALWHREHADALARTAGLVAEAAAQGGGEAVELPRAVGQLEFRVGGAKGRRMAFSYDVWMLQRLLQEVARAPADEVEAFFGRVSVGFSPLLSVDAAACQVHRRRGQRSKPGNNLFSGSGAGMEPAWVGGAARVELVSSKL